MVATLEVDDETLAFTVITLERGAAAVTAALRSVPMSTGRDGHE